MPEYRVRVDGFEVSRHGYHVIYAITVARGDAQWPIRRRFRQVATLHAQLLQSLGRSAIKAGLPTPPPKVTCRSMCRGRFDQGFLQTRAVQLQSYFESLLRYIPFVDQCEVLYEFLCSVDLTHMSYDNLLDLGQALGRGGATRVDPAAIAALPAQALEDTSPMSFLSCCVICQERMKPEEDIRVLPCGHTYHFPCISKWIAQSNTCCVCQGTAVMPQTPK